MTNTFEPDFAEAELRERLERLIDKADNLLAAAGLPVSDSIHAQGLKYGMQAIRADLVALCHARGYEDDNWMFAHAPDPEPLPPEPPEDWEEDDDDVPHYDTPGGW